MKHLYQSLLLALAITGAAFAQVPATNDTSSTDGKGNTGMGTGALGGPAATNGGSFITASGYQALYSNTTGDYNSASGYQALYSNTTGKYNTASGAYALRSNVGRGNTAFGFEALYYNGTGLDNTASGAYALISNTSGNNNTAAGFEALMGAPVTADDSSGATGSNNTGIGTSALFSYSTGGNNTASGFEALYTDTTGAGNTASGYKALFANLEGLNNTAVGASALLATTGSNNIAEGFQAGSNLTTGNDNIDIGNKGVAAESHTIRIGTAATQNATYIAGIATAKVTGNAVYVTSSGQLGVLASSERFKTAVVSLRADTAKLAHLRPVSFKLKSDATGTRQYGLIAEEVAKVYPELVIRDDRGRIEGVRYEELAPMLLNEVQRQQQKIAAMEQQLARVQVALLNLAGHRTEN